MQSKITSKYQVTIPKEVRAKLKLSVKDGLEWHIDEGRVTVGAAKKPFLAYRGVVRIGKGDIRTDIEEARRTAVKKYG
jgi:AbrB family looped-hinge helix DNA binding protein